MKRAQYRPHLPALSRAPETGRIKSFSPVTTDRSGRSHCAGAKVDSDFAPAQLLGLLVAQTALLLHRAHLGLPLDARSLRNLADVASRLAEEVTQ